MKRIKHILTLLLLLWVTGGLYGTLSAQDQVGRKVGELIEFSDGSKGIVCYVDPDFPTCGWAMALKDFKNGTKYELYDTKPISEFTVIPRDFNYVKRYQLSNSDKAAETRFEGRRITDSLYLSNRSPLVKAMINNNPDYKYFNGWYIPNQMQLWTIFVLSDQIRQGL